MNSKGVKGLLTSKEERDMNNYINHSMNIGSFENFVKEKRVEHGVVYRGLRLHKSEIKIGNCLTHFEPLLSCSEELEVSETFSLNGIIPEDIVNEKILELGRDLDLDWELTHDEFHPVVLEIEGAEGVRLLDYLPDTYDYSSEKEVVLLNEPLEILSIDIVFTKFGEEYKLIQVKPVKSTERKTV